MWKKLAGLLAVVYFLSPVDAVPDFIPILGWLDDLGVLSASAFWMVRQVQQYNPAPKQDGMPRDLDGRMRLPPVRDSV
ncbi:MAG TPA: YkvA family protein [Hyalangium sp.]|nr:YkvA family protein [Hyalangium sp.]